MNRLRYYMNWLFRDLTERRGKYVIAEVPNAPLIIFMVALILSLAVYADFWQNAFALISYIALGYWGYLEYRTGRSRFRKLLGILGMVSVAGALLVFGI